MCAQLLVTFILSHALRTRFPRDMRIKDAGRRLKSGWLSACGIRIQMKLPSLNLQSVLNASSLIFTLVTLVAGPTKLYAEGSDGPGTHYHNGKLMPQSASQTPSGTVGSGLFITSTQSNYQPGDIVTVNLENTGPAITGDLQIMIAATIGSTAYPPFPCDCGGSNYGNIPGGLVQNQRINLIHYQILPGTYGMIEFSIIVSTVSAQNTQTQILVASFNAYVGTGTQKATAVIGVESIHVVTTKQGTSQLVLSGTFPKNIPMMYEVGIPGYEDSEGYGVYSTDGKNLVVPDFGDQNNPTGNVGRAYVQVLNPDGNTGPFPVSFSATSPEFTF